jgi:outer membrane protein insertion porin family
MKLLSPFVLILCLIAMHLPASAQTGGGRDTTMVDYRVPRKYEIGGIKVTGHGAIREQVVVARTGLQVGDRITIPGDDISNAIKNLWNTGLFSQVNIGIERTFGDVAFLIIELQERPRLTRYFIRGVRDSEVDDLREKINLTRGDPVTDFEQTRIENLIERFYADKGFTNVAVSFTLKADTAVENSVVLFVDIDKGKKVKIADITIEGNEQVSDNKLRSVMKDTKKKTQVNITPSELLKAKDPEHKKGLLHILGNISRESVSTYFEDKLTLRIFTASKFDEQKYRDDKVKIIDYYNSLGYRDATITFDTVVKVDEANLAIKMHIDEGRRYYFRNIVFSGNQRYSDQILASILNIEKGEIYDQTLLDRRLYFDMNGNDISSLYMDDGYLFFNVTPREVRVEGDSIDLEIRIIEGPQATINRIIIKGNDKTSEKVIRRELRTLPGQQFSRSDLIRTQREIASLGYFDPEQIGINPIPNPEDGTVDIEYTVVEKPSDQIELSAGWGGFVGGLFGSAGIVFNNFSLRKLFSAEDLKRGLPAGDGQQLSLRMQTRGKFLQSYTFSFVEPWMGGKKPNAFSVSLNYTLFNQLGLDRTEPNAQFIVIKGGSVGYGKRLRWPDDFFYLNSSINLENYNLKNYPEFILTTGKANNLNITERISRVSITGNPNFPHGGSNVSLMLKFTPPYSLFRNVDYSDLSLQDRYRWIEYHKWRFNADWYTLLAGSEAQGKRKLVLRASAKMGFLGAYNLDKTGLPPFERFRVGGDGLSGMFLLQGFDIISLRGTENPFQPVGATRANEMDGTIFNKFTMELRYPISLQQASTIYVMTFLEGGNSYLGFDNYNPFDLRKSAGIGVRLFLPMFGLLGFDYGIPLDNLNGRSFGDLMNNGAFQFRIGFEPD